MTKRTIELSSLRVGNRPANISTEVEIPDSLQILEDLDERPEGFGCFRVMTPQDGDKRVVWDSRSFQQIVEAKEMFNQLVSQGLVPYRVGLDGQATAEVMDEFDPHSEEVIFLPVAMVAGG